MLSATHAVRRVRVRVRACACGVKERSAKNASGEGGVPSVAVGMKSRPGISSSRKLKMGARVRVR